MRAHTHLHLSGEIDHVQFPTKRSPTASFECINNSTPLHLSSLAFLHTAFISLTHSARSHACAPRWIPPPKLLDVDEELQNEIPASRRLRQVPAAAPLRHVSRRLRQTSLSSASPEPPPITLHYSQHAVQLAQQLRGCFHYRIIVLLINRLNVTARTNHPLTLNNRFWSTKVILYI